ncbi:MAG: tetratricopeptide repeat protein [Deltaproteobacteria bacterium]
MSFMKIVCAMAFAVALTACEAGGTGGTGGNPFAPSGAARGDSVDGLIVGHRLMAANEYELALKAYYRAAADKGLTVDVLSAIGSADMRLGRLGQAESVLRKAIETDGTFVPAWNNLGVVLIESRKYDEAVEVFRRAFALDSGQTEEIRDNLSLALETQKKIRYGSTPEEVITNFALVRRGNGEYLLLSEP